ncbi:MAG: phytoene dehydrogenase, partial [Anaeromyxobacteraceae bacterium]
ICAAAAVPAEPWTRESVKACADRIRSGLAAAIPFFDRHVIFESIPTLAGIGDGEPYADAADPLYAPDDGAALGVAGIPVQGPLTNLFLASRDVLPGLGLEGELYAGIQAAAHAATALGHKERPSR